MNQRIQQLEAFLREEPDDPFNSYALALEYLKVDAGKASELFQKLVATRPDYLPTYYPFAHLLIEQHQHDEAESIFRKGIDNAAAQGAEKTRRELQNAYNDWLFDRS